MMMSLKNVYVTLGANTKLERNVLKGLSMEITEGEFVVLIGGNGAGKSTLFSILSGYRLPDKGSIFIDKTDVTKISQPTRSAFVSEVMQDPKLGTMEKMTIEENLSFALMRGRKRHLLPHNTKSRRNLFREKLSLLNMKLEDRMDELVGNLSGGQRQALALIMAVLTESKVLLLDEITAALDPKTAENVMNLAAKIVEEQKQTTLMITHNMHHAIQYGDRLMLLQDGKITKKYSKSEKSALTPLTIAQEFCD